MKRSLSTSLPVLALAALMIGCGGKEENKPVTVSEYKEYSDPVLKFGVSYPADWAQGIQPGSRAVFYSSKEVADGFSTFQPNNQRGAKIDVGGMKGGTEAMNADIANLKGMFTDQSVLKAPEQTTLAGMPATKISYSFDVEDTKFTAERYYVIKDSVVTYLETAVIGNYDNYKPVFEKVMASFKPGAAQTAAPATAAPGDTSAAAPKDSALVEPPSANLKPYAGPHFSINYPDNFDPSTGGGRGLVSSVTFSGARNDSYFRVDEMDIKGSKDLSLDKAVDQVKGSYGGKAPASATVGGQKAAMFNYSGGKDVSSRAYFVMANGKLFRITLNWFTPQQSLYLPAFEKSLATFSAK